MPATTMSVQLLTMTPDAEALVYAAMRQCYSDEDAVKIFDQATFDINTEDGCNKIYALIKKVLDSGHDSPIEHVSFSFAISGVSRALSHQLVRHRIASFSMQSQRYVKAGDFEYVVPDSCNRPENMPAVHAFGEAMDAAKTAYAKLLELGIPAEDARFVLPNAAATKVVATMNCRSLLHFFEERCCNRAQWEIRALAKAMLAICKDKLPVVFANAGPKCKRLGRCPEAKSCRQHVEQMAKDGGAANV